MTLVRLGRAEAGLLAVAEFEGDKGPGHAEFQGR